LLLFLNCSKVTNDMFMNKIRKILSKKILLYSFVLCVIITSALTFITHSTCACGDKVERSLLSIIVRAIARDIRHIFN
jgi:hypothetical protein